MEKNGGGEVSKVSVENFLSQSAEKFVGETFSLSLFSGIENFYASEGYVTIFRQSFLSHSTEKIRRGTLQSFIRFGNRINFCLRGFCHDFPSKFFCLAVAN